ncbi:MAG: hypothetical protein OER21_07460 [Gemmatimonadota bacterium]|nr:hypothetical protein [Gemmatimonadota bacterium]
MFWRSSRILATALVLSACERDAPPRAAFSFEAAAEPVPVLVIHSDWVTRPPAARQREVHVMLPTGITEAVARATLQHLIDSVRTADSAPPTIRVVGFAFGPLDAKTGLADVVPAISAVRSAGDRAAPPRTEFFIHRAFPDSETGPGR